MPIISVINQKGGSGKSTTAVHLIAWLFDQDLNCCLVDTDGQNTSSNWLNRADLPIPYRVIPDPDELLDTIPELTESYNWIVIDGAANLSESTRAAILRSDLALIPIQPTGVDLDSASATVRLIKQAHSIRNGLPKTAAFLSRAVKNTRLKDEAIKVLNHIDGILFFRAIIHQRQVIADAFGQDSTVFDLSGTSAGIAGREYKELFEEVIQLLRTEN